MRGTIEAGAVAPAVTITKEESGMGSHGHKKYYGNTYHTINGYVKKQPSLSWFLHAYIWDEEDKQEAIEAIKGYVMGYVMTDAEWAAARGEGDGEEAIYGTLSMIEDTLRCTLRSLREAEGKVANPGRGRSLERCLREKEAYGLLAVWLEERLRLLKKEIRKTERKKAKK